MKKIKKEAKKRTKKTALPGRNRITAAKPVKKKKKVATISRKTNKTNVRNESSKSKRKISKVTGQQKSSLNKKNITLSRINEKIRDLLQSDKNDAEIFHECATFLRNSIGFAFLNVYQNFPIESDKKDLYLIGVHENDLSYFISPGEPLQKATLRLDLQSIDISVTRESSLLDHPENLPIFGIEDNKIRHLSEIQASSAIAIPLEDSKMFLGLIVLAIQAPRLPYTMREQSIALKTSVIIKNLLLKKMIDFQQEELRKREREFKEKIRNINIERENDRKIFNKQHEEKLISLIESYDTKLHEKEKAISLNVQQENTLLNLQEKHKTTINALEDKISLLEKNRDVIKTENISLNKSLEHKSDLHLHDINSLRAELKHQYENEKKELITKFNDERKVLNENARIIENELKNELRDIQNETKKIRELQSKQKSSLNQKENDYLQQIHSLNETIAVKNKVIENATTDIPVLREELKIIRQKFSTEIQKSERLEKVYNAAVQEKESFENQISELKQNSERKQRTLHDEFDQMLEGVKTELEKTKIDLKNTKEKLQQVEIVHQQEKQEMGKSRIVAEKELHLECEGLKAELKNSRTLEAGSNKVSSQLKNEIGIHRERETQLKQAIALLETEKHNLKKEIAIKNEKNADLQHSFEEQLQSLTENKSNLLNVYKKQEKLKEELNLSISREKGSKEAGKLIAHITGSITELPDITDKIHFLKNNAIPSENLQRIFLFGFFDEKTLTFEAGFWGDYNMKSFINTQILLHDTIFGHAIATGKTQIIEATEKIKYPDIPEALYNVLPVSEIDRAKSQDNTKKIVFIPISEAGKNIGLISLAASSKLPAHRIKLLEQIAPLIAVALTLEKNKNDMIYLNNINRFATDVRLYIENRFIETQKTLFDLSHQLNEIIENNSQIFTEDIKKQLRVQTETVLLDFGNQNTDAKSFYSWLEKILKFAAKKTGLGYRLDIPLETLEALKRQLGAAFYNLYWIFEEAISNVIIHSKAKRLEITAVQNKNQIMLNIIDDGEGIIRTAGTDAPKNGKGLQAIRNLIGNSGGNVDFGRDKQGYGLSLRMSWKRY